MRKENQKLSKGMTETTLTITLAAAYRQAASANHIEIPFSCLQNWFDSVQNGSDAPLLKKYSIYIV